MPVIRDLSLAVGAAVRRRAGLIAAALLLVALAASLAYWPGLMIWDSARQYDQAISGEFDDWHPPAMEALWRICTFVWKGPAPMLLIQLALYALGFGLLIRRGLREVRRERAIALAACALLPLSVALMGEVIKDSLMTAALVCAVGLWIGAAPARASWRIAPAILLVIASASLRYNAFLAGLPLLAAMAPPSWRDRPVRLAGLCLAITAALMVVMPVANAALRAEKSGVEYSLTIFDLAGIARFSGAEPFPPIAGVADAGAAASACYTPLKWDSFSEWAARPCPVHFDVVREAFERRGASQRLWWLREIVAHPIAYLHHRLAHWAINTGLLEPPIDGRPVEMQSAPNDWNFRVPQTPAVRLVDAAAWLEARTPPGWPACWMALAFGLAVLAPALRSGRWIGPLALSGLLYGLGYAVFSVATGERYYFWTWTASALAAALALTEPVDWRAIRRWRLTAAAAPLLAVLALSVGARLV